MSETPIFEDVLSSVISTASRKVRVWMPGRVETYNSATQRASIQPLLRDTKVEEDGSISSIRHSVLPDCPCYFMGGGGFAATNPVVSGDLAIVLFCDRSLDLWKADGSEIDNPDPRTHDLSDAIALVGLSARPINAPGDRQRIGHQQGAHIDVTTGEVLVGGVGAVATLRGPAYRAAEDTMLGLVRSALALVAKIPGLTPVEIATVTAATAAISVFTSNDAAYLTTIAKVL